MKTLFVNLSNVHIARRDTFFGDRNYLGKGGRRICRKIHSRLLLVAVLFISSFNLVAGTNDKECNPTCSNQVKCSFERLNYFCAHGKYTGPEQFGPGVPKNLNYRFKDIGNTRFITLIWEVPDDSSVYSLEGFAVNVFRHNKLGKTEWCYKVSLGSNWVKYHSPLNETIKIYISCLRVNKNSFDSYAVEVHSLPIHSSRPKNSSLTFSVNKNRKVTSIVKSEVKRWADENNVLHVEVIHKPPKPDVKIYEISVFAEKSEHVVLTRKFNLSQRTSLVENGWIIDSKPYVQFLLPNLTVGQRYRLHIELSNENGFPLYNPYETGFFKPNFTSPALILPSPSIKWETICVPILVVIIGIIIIVVCLFHPGCRNRLVCSKSPWIRPEASLPRILAIYCYENDHFVKAVKQHVKLLRKYVSVLTLQEFARHPRSLFCRFTSQQRIQREVKNREVIIYLSPRLNDLLEKKQIAMTSVDKLCMEALNVLQHQSRNYLPHIVSFNCFNDQDFVSLQKLTEMLKPKQAHIDPYPPCPLTLASFNQRKNEWSLNQENFQKLLLDLLELREFPASAPIDFLRWKDSKEAKDVERSLFLIHSLVIEEHTVSDSELNDPGPSISQLSIESIHSPEEDLDESEGFPTHSFIPPSVVSDVLKEKVDLHETPLLPTNNPSGVEQSLNNLDASYHRGKSLKHPDSFYENNTLSLPKQNLEQNGCQIDQQIYTNCNSSIVVTDIKPHKDDESNSFSVQSLDIAASSTNNIDQNCVNHNGQFPNGFSVTFKDRHNSASTPMKFRAPNGAERLFIAPNMIGSSPSLDSVYRKIDNVSHSPF